jgi:TonB family protein
MHMPSTELFSMLPESRPPWKEFLCSIGTQSLLLIAVAWLGVLHPEIIIPSTRNVVFVGLVNNVAPLPQHPAPLRMFKSSLAHLPQPSPDPKALHLPPEVAPKAPEPEPEPEQIARFERPPERVVTPTQHVIPRELVKTNVFSNGSSATPTMARAPQQVQTGGFGDPNSVPSRETNKRPVNIAQAGGFDMPNGPGSGNGIGGSGGVRGVVASAGFGNGVAVGDGSGRSNASRGTVRQSGFDDTGSSTAAQPTRTAQSAAPKVTPAEILSKPTPAYTEEARRLRIEGEVLLEVVFQSSGTLHVIRVIHGLGHGLDEAAIQAAQQIHFKPALRDGQPSDSTAVLHILFQLT